MIENVYASKTSLSSLLLFIALSFSCAQKHDPQKVAREFWTGIEQSNAQIVRRHITAADARSLNDLDNLLPIANPRLNRIVIENNTAYIDTVVTVYGDKPLDFPLKTYLIIEDGTWKVSYYRTIDVVTKKGKLAAIVGKIRDFSNALREEIDQSGEKLERALPQIEQELSRIEDQINQHVPELRQRLKHFARQLEDAIKNLHKEAVPVQPQNPLEI